MGTLHRTTFSGPGWQILDRPVIGKSPFGHETRIDYAILFPKNGLSLLDISPHLTRNAIAKVRRTLDAVQFSVAYPCLLPIVYRQITPNDYPRLVTQLDKAFAEVPPLPADWGASWTNLVLYALEGDPVPDLSQIGATTTVASLPIRRSRAARVAAWVGVGSIGAVCVAAVAMRNPQALQLLPINEAPANEVKASGVVASVPDAPASTPEPSRQQADVNLPATQATSNLPPALPPPDRNAATPAAPAMSASDAEALISRGDAALARHDLHAARQAYEQAANGGSGVAAILMGRTYDPAVQRDQKEADLSLAKFWYATGRIIGGRDVDSLMQYVNGGVTRP